MNLTFYVEVALEVLLAATLGYCILLERRLAAVRKGQEGLKTTIGELNMAIAGAGASLRALKSAAGEAAVTLDDRLKRARLHIDELSVLVGSGERIATRMESAASQRGGMESAASQRGGMENASTSRPRPEPDMPRGDFADQPLPSSSIMNRLNANQVRQ